MRQFALIIALITVSMVAFAKHPKMGAGMPPPAVSVETAKSTQFQQSILATGTLSAMQGIMVKPEITGRVSQIFFKSGQDVNQGTPLISLNQDILQAQLKLNQANLVLRKQQFKRSQELVKENAISKADYDTAFANLTSAQAEVDQASAQLRQAIITAPFAGRLGLRLVSVGDYVTPGQDIINLQSLDPIIVNFSIPENYLNQIAVGDNILISCDSFPKQKFSGKVYAYDSVVDPNTRTLAMRARIANPNKKLLPGMFVNVALFAGAQQKIVTVPQTAIVASLDGNYVYKIINHHAVKTKVNVARLDNQLAFITSGIQAGDLIITAGQIKITGDNTPVTVITPNQKA
jgi:membrane fusion protein (multidrug efflux system)